MPDQIKILLLLQGWAAKICLPRRVLESRESGQIPQLAKCWVWIYY